MNNNIMVCVTQQKNCERLIQKGKKLLEEELGNGQLYVIHVVNEKDKFLYQVDDSSALEYLFEVSKEAEAELIVRRSSEVLKTLTKEAKAHKVKEIVMGTAGNAQNCENKFEQKLRGKLKNAQFHIL